MSGIYKLESTADLLPALDKLHELIQLMQGTDADHSLQAEKLFCWRLPMILEDFV